MIIPGVIDNDYTGELSVVAVYVGEEAAYNLPAGSRVAQVLFHFAVRPALLPTVHTERGDKGFGSTDEERSANVFNSFPSNQMQVMDDG